MFGAVVWLGLVVDRYLDTVYPVILLYRVLHQASFRLESTDTCAYCGMVVSTLPLGSLLKFNEPSGVITQAVTPFAESLDSASAGVWLGLTVVRYLDTT